MKQQSNEGQVQLSPVDQIRRRLPSSIQWLKPAWPTTRRHWRLVAAGLILGALTGLGILGYVRTQRPLTVALANQQTMNVYGPVTVEFGQDVSADLKPMLSPAVAGSWQSRSGLFGVQAIRFKPDGKFVPGLQYTVTITHLRRAGTGATLPDISRTIHVQIPPELKSISPDIGSSNLPTRPKLTIVLASKNAGVRELQASLAPAAELKQSSTDDQTFVWEPVAPLKQGVKYTFTVTDASIPDTAKQVLAATSFSTVTPPGVVSARAGDHLAPGQTIDIVFNQPMLATGANLIKFDLTGSGAWKDDHTYSYTPAELKTGTTYTYRLKAGLPTQAGGVLEADMPYTITTNGVVTTGINPSSGEVKPNTPISFAFDQPVDHGSAEFRLSISPAAPGKFSWSGNTMTWTGTGMAYETKYTVSLAAGVVPTWGQPSTKAYSATVTTAAEIIQMNVPARGAAYWMGCELASLNMLLKYRGINTGDYDILMKLRYNPRAFDAVNKIWDDPNEMYVGYVDGRPGTTGYGVHAGPLAAAGRQYGRNTQAYYNVSASWISEQIHNGNPVLFYGYSDASPYGYSWTTPAGKTVTGVYPQHARVIWGVRGSVSNPQGFWMNETMTAGTQYWTAAHVMENMNAVPGASNMAVVVY